MGKRGCFFKGVLGGIVFLGFVAVLFPLYSDYAARAALDKSLQMLETYRRKVARIAATQGSVEVSGVRVTIPEQDYARLNVDYARVFPDGTIVIRHAKYSQIVVLEPSITAGKISFKCIGGPKRDVTPDCR